MDRGYSNIGLLDIGPTEKVARKQPVCYRGITLDGMWQWLQRRVVVV